MKIAISADGTGKKATVDARFGRCAKFVFVDTDAGTFEIKSNAAVASGHGAGIQASQYIVQEGAEAVIAGRMGPNAFGVLNAAGIPVYEGPGLSVEEAVERLLAGELRQVGGPTGAAHSGRRMRPW
ncbi:MAG: NifB/NifX family molybdenum-iron cluster-binding protein [Anaerolineae bacterium]